MCIFPGGDFQVFMGGNVPNEDGDSMQVALPPQAPPQYLTPQQLLQHPIIPQQILQQQMPGGTQQPQQFPAGFALQGGMVQQGHGYNKGKDAELTTSAACIGKLPKTRLQQITDALSVQTHMDGDVLGSIFTAELDERSLAQLIFIFTGLRCDIPGPLGP